MRFVTLALAAGCLAAAMGLAPASSAALQPPPAGGAQYDEAKLKALETRMKDLEAKLAKNPRDAKLKKQAADANYEYGHGLMYSGRPPREKYRGALRYFRRTLQLDPKNSKAAAEEKTIEDIYKQMGMPVP